MSNKRLSIDLTLLSRECRQNCQNMSFQMVNSRQASELSNFLMWACRTSLKLSARSSRMSLTSREILICVTFNPVLISGLHSIWVGLALNEIICLKFILQTNFSLQGPPVHFLLGSPRADWFLADWSSGGREKGRWKRQTCWEDNVLASGRHKCIITQIKTFCAQYAK